MMQWARPSFLQRGFLCLALLAAGCHRSPPANTGVPDAGATEVDAGLPAGPQAIGGACASDGDCVSGLCDKVPTGGYCVATCSDNTSCPEGSVCELLPLGQAYCVATCSKGTECRAGYACAKGSVLCVPGKGGCTTNADCKESASCDPASGLCSDAFTAHNTIGGACADDSACTAGAQPFCIGEDMNFSAGYCSSTCRRDSDCGGRNPCVTGLVSDNPALALCMERCGTDADCRANYSCLTFQGDSFCFAHCKTNKDCIDTTQTCEVSTGLCSGGADADGGSPDAGSRADGGALDGGTLEVDGGSGEQDAGAFVYDGGYPGPFPTQPQVANSGGKVLTSPKFVPVFFANDDEAQVTAITDFLQRVGATKYWTAITQEYGIGAGVALPVVRIPEIATGTITDTNIQDWLAARIVSGVLPAPDDNTLYVLHYPASMTIVLQGSQSCGSFGAYHSDVVVTYKDVATGNDVARDVAYAVVPRCLASGRDTVDTETAAESHELVEAATDPHPMNAPAFGEVDEDHLEWALALGGGEVGDMCAQNGSSYVKFPELPYQVQRSWSNAAAASGHDPCVPAIEGSVYFAAAPEMNDDLTLSYGGQQFSVKGIRVLPGKSRTVPLFLYSDGDTKGPWSVTVRDFNGRGGASTFQYSVDPPSGVNGQPVTLTITNKSAAGSNSHATFFITSHLGNEAHSWIGAAGP